MAEYPATLPTFTDPTATSKLNSPSHSDLHAQANAEIVAITTELGTDPAGSFSTVKERIADLETHIITNAGTDNGLLITQNGVLSGANALRIIAGVSQGTPLVYISQTGTGQGIQIAMDSTAPGVDLNVSGTGVGVQITNTGTGSSIDLTSTINSSGALTGIYFNLANAGAGLEYAFNFSGSEAVAGAVGGSQDKKIRIKVGSTDYFIPCYTT